MPSDFPHVWQFNDCWLRFYVAGELEDNEDAQPIMDPCYCESLGIAAALEFERRPRLAKSTREIVATGEWDDVVVSFSGLYFRKESDYKKDEVFNRTKRLDIVMTCESVISGREDEVHHINNALATSFRLQGSDNQDLIYSGSLAAEEFV